MNKKIQNYLIAIGDSKYKSFHSKLIPNVLPKKIIGVKIPDLRLCAKKLLKFPCYHEFLNSLPHFYYEENTLHALIISMIKDFDCCIIEVCKFLPYIDNWATCDSLRPVSFKNNKSTLLNYIEEWICSDNEYIIRFGIEMLMIHYLDSDFDKRYMEMVSKTKSEDYYVKMMIAWYFATALAKQPESALTHLKDNKLDKWTHNKTIQKAIESYRIPVDLKNKLKEMKR